MAASCSLVTGSLGEKVVSEVPLTAPVSAAQFTASAYQRPAFTSVKGAVVLLAGSPAPIYATATPCETLQRHGVSADRLRTIRPDETVTVGPFSITAFPGRHCTFDKPLIRQTLLSPRLWGHFPRALRLLGYSLAYPERGETLLYEVRADGKRIQILGSLGLCPAVSYPTGADALILPYQGRSDLVTYGWPLVERLAPRAVYLDHYDDSFPPLTAAIDTTPFCDLLTARGIPCRALVPLTIIDL